VRFLLSSFGSAGDVRPVLSVGQALARAGHETVCVLDPAWCRVAEVQYGLSAVPFGQPWDPRALANHPEWLDPKSGSLRMLTDLVIPRTPELVRTARRVAADLRPDAIIGHHISFGLPWVADELDLPWIMCAAAPSSWPSIEDPNLYPGMPDRDRYPKWTIRLGTAAATKMINRTIDPAINAVRRDLGLRPQKQTMLQGQFSRGLNLGLWSKHYRGKASDDPRRAEIVGFPEPAADQTDHGPLLGALRSARSSSAKIVAWSLGTTAVHAGGGHKDRFIEVARASGFTPVILTQILTENETDAVTGRIRKIGTSSFDYLLQEQETTRTAHIGETVGYIALEPGIGEIGNMLYEAGSTANSVTQNWTDLTFQTEFPALPHFIADMQTTDGGDSAAVRSQNMSQTATQIKIEEEQSKDAEVDHTTEVVGYLLIGSKTADAEQPAAPTTGEKMFTFTWEYGDTQNVSGFRFYLNGSLLCETTNPDDRQISCYAALLNETMEFTMTAVFVDGSEGAPSNLLTLNPADYPELFGIRLVTLSWDYDASQENSISGFRIYNNAQLVCETADTSARQISCETATQGIANNFSITAVESSASETSPSNEIQYNP